MGVVVRNGLEWVQCFSPDKQGGYCMLVPISPEVQQVSSRAFVIIIIIIPFCLWSEHIPRTH